MADTPSSTPTSKNGASRPSRDEKRKERNRRGMKFRANRSPNLHNADEDSTGEVVDVDPTPEPPPATDVRSHAVRWGIVGGASVALGIAGGFAYTVQIGLFVAVAVALCGAAFLTMLFPPPVHRTNADPAGLNFGRTAPPEAESNPEGPPERTDRAARRRRRDQS